MRKKVYDFTTSFAKDADYSGGMRAFFQYRDLNLTEATKGDYVAHVIRATDAAAKEGEGTGRHYHDVDFQFVYVLKGWVKFEYEGKGEFHFEAGDSVLQPSGIRHQLTACSADMELLEIVSPADFATENLGD